MNRNTSFHQKNIKQRTNCTNAPEKEQHSRGSDEYSTYSKAVSAKRNLLELQDFICFENVIMKTRETEILFVSFSRTHTCAMKKKWTHKDARVTEFGVFLCVSAISGVHFGVEFQNCNKMCNSCNFLVQSAKSNGECTKTEKSLLGKKEWKANRQTEKCLQSNSILGIGVLQLLHTEAPFVRG